jgi:hypothetical protein
MLLSKVMYEPDRPCAWAPRGAFPSSAITVLLFGVMVSCQGGVLGLMLALLLMPGRAGIICVSYLLWVLLWIVLYCLISDRKSVGTLPVWMAIVLRQRY